LNNSFHPEGDQQLGADVFSYSVCSAHYSVEWPFLSRDGIEVRGDSGNRAIPVWITFRLSASCVAHRLLQGGAETRTCEREEKLMPSLQALDEVLRRVQGGDMEMPGLRLTTAQAQRLWGLDRAACDALLGALVDAKFLLRTRDGAFVRSDISRLILD